MASLSEVWRGLRNDPCSPFLLAMKQGHSQPQSSALTLLMKARSEAKTCFSDTSDCPFLRKAR